MYNYYSLSPILFWRELSFSYRLFVLILIVVVLHSLVSAAIVLKRLRELRKTHRFPGAPDPAWESLNARCVNVRQSLGAAFYLFGFLFFAGLLGAYHTIGSRTSPSWEILINFQVHFLFAAIVFLVLVCLHVVQWIVATLLQASVRKLHS